MQALPDVKESEQLILEIKKAEVKSYIEITRVAIGESEITSDDEQDENAADDVILGLKDVAAERN